jgi:hypothetical protein
MSNHIIKAANIVNLGYVFIPKVPYDQEAINAEIPKPIINENAINVIKVAELSSFNLFIINKDIGPPSSIKKQITNKVRPNIISN